MSLNERPTATAPTALAAARDRLARTALLTYLGAAAVALVVLLSALATDKAHEESALRERLLLGTVLRAEYLGRHLAMLTFELERLGQSAEIDPDDGSLVPEQDLLRLTHRNSAFFNVGVAILDERGSVIWSEPQRFLAPGEKLDQNSGFATTKRDGRVHVVPVNPDREDALVYVIAPVARHGRFAGALLGAIDLAAGGPVAPPPGEYLTVLASRDGEVVFPPLPPAFADSPAFQELASQAGATPAIRRVNLSGIEREIAVSPVADTNWLLLSMADVQPLYQPALRRMLVRLVAALILLLAPLFILAFRFRRAVRIFRRSEDGMVQADRLRLLGEASNAIAHEVKNSLNGIRIGLDLVLQRGKGDGRVVDTLRGEVQRLTDFTSDLLLFSKGPTPRLRPVELGAFVRKVADLQVEVAAEHGILIDVLTPGEPVEVLADPALGHVILANLISNAIDAVAGAAPEHPRVEIRLESRGGRGRIHVEDNGNGIAPEVRARLFEPFVTGKPSGVGIGLALSRNLALAQAGELTIEPANHGAHFCFTLPLAERTKS